MPGPRPASKLPFRMKAWKDELKASQFPDHITIQVARTSAIEQAALIGKVLEEMGWIRTGGGTSKGDASEDGKTRHVDSWFTEERDFELVDGLGEKGRKALTRARIPSCRLEGEVQLH